MSGFNTKERNNNGEYEITFYTESRQDFEKVQDLCRELIGHNKPVSIKGDLISRNDFKNKFISTISVGRLEFGDIINLIDNAPTVVDRSLEIAKKRIELGRKVGNLEGRIETARPQGEWSDLSTYGRHTGWIVCSVCGQEPPSESNLRTNFCPNCGADMRKGGATNDSQDK